MSYNRILAPMRSARHFLLYYQSYFIKALFNNSKLAILFAFPFFLLLFCSPLSSNFSADGYVVNQSSHNPISQANVTLSCNGKNSHSITNANGYFKIGISIYPDSSDAAVLDIQKEGYNSYSTTIHSLWSSTADTFYLVQQ